MTIITRSTPLIEVESEEYPLYLNDVISRLKNMLLPATVDSELLKELGYEVVNDSDRPDADVVVEGKPENKNGEWYKTWEGRSYNEEEKETSLKTKKDTQRARITSFQNQEFAKGFPYNFDGQVYHVQVRISDRSNIDSIRTLAKEAKDEGNSDWAVSFRVWENVTVNLNAQEFIDLANTAFMQVSSAYQRVWDFKDAVEEAKTESDFPQDYQTLFNEL